MPKTGGLGLKRKLAEKDSSKDGATAELKLKKAKTLAEKRDQLQDEIMKYGVAAIEKMYPRQPFYQQQKSPEKMRPGGQFVRGSPIKMKPKPIGLDFDEVDVRKILRPLSHSKYIKEPDYDHMVFISRREGKNQHNGTDSIKITIVVHGRSAVKNLFIIYVLCKEE